MIFSPSSDFILERNPNFLFLLRVLGWKVLPLDFHLSEVNPGAKELETRPKYDGVASETALLSASWSKEASLACWNSLRGAKPDKDEKSRAFAGSAASLKAERKNDILLGRCWGFSVKMDDLCESTVSCSRFDHKRQITGLFFSW